MNVCMTLGIYEDALKQLEYAKNLSSYGHSRLAINNNILAYKNSFNIEDDLLIAEIEDQIENRTFASTRIIRNCYTNIYLYYKNKNNIILANKYYKKIFDYGPVEKYFEKWITNNELDPKIVDYYFSKPKYPLNYIIEWTIEISNSLMSFE